MKFIVEGEEKIKFHTNLKNIKKYVERERKRLRRGFEIRRIEYVFFANNKIEFEKLANLFIALENRYQIARYCLYNISKQCKTTTYELKGNLLQRKLTEIKFRLMKRRLRNEKIKHEFLIRCEYFIFAINSCLGIMAHILNWVYKLKLKGTKAGSMYWIYNKMKPKRNKFSRYLLKDWKGWIDNFGKIRNKMTHHQIITFSSQFSHKVQEEKIIYTKHCISVNIDGKIVTKKLPKYFEDVLSNYEKLVDEFYKKLNTIKIETN